MFGRKNTIDIQRYIDRLDQDRRDTEQRLNASITQVEQRLNESIVQVEQRLNESIAQTNVNIVQTEQRLESKIDKLEGKIDTFVAETKTAHKWLIGIVVGSMVSATGVILTVINLLINGNGM